MSLVDVLDGACRVSSRLKRVVDTARARGEADIAERAQAQRHVLWAMIFELRRRLGYQ